MREFESQVNIPRLTGYTEIVSSSSFSIKTLSSSLSVPRGFLLSPVLFLVGDLKLLNDSLSNYSVTMRLYCVFDVLAILYLIIIDDEDTISV